MPDPLRVRVLTDTGVAIDEHAVSLVAPGELGYLGVLRNHAPLVTTLAAGTLTWRTSRGERRALTISSGLLEILHNHVTVLTTIVEGAAHVA